MSTVSSNRPKSLRNWRNRCGQSPRISHVLMGTNRMSPRRPRRSDSDPVDPLRRLTKITGNETYAPESSQ